MLNIITRYTTPILLTVTGVALLSAYLAHGEARRAHEKAGELSHYNESLKSSLLSSQAEIEALLDQTHNLNLMIADREARQKVVTAVHQQAKSKAQELRHEAHTNPQDCNVLSAPVPPAVADLVRDAHERASGGHKGSEGTTAPVLDR